MKRSLVTNVSSSPNMLGAERDNSKLYASILFGAALITPPAFLIYKMRTDYEFRERMGPSFPERIQPLFGPKPPPSKATVATAVASTIIPTNKVEIPQPLKDVKLSEKAPLAVPATVGISSPNVMMMTETMTVSKVKMEIESLERRLEQAKEFQKLQNAKNGITISFSKQETETMQKKIDQVVATTTTPTDTTPVKSAPSTPSTVPSPSEVPVQAPLSPIVEKTPEAIVQNVPSRVDLSTLRAEAEAVLVESAKRTRDETESMLRQLNRDLEKVLATDLATLNEAGLRERLVHLILELKDRNKWEALRMQEALKQTTLDLVEKYEDLLRRQAATYEKVVSEEIIKASNDAIKKTSAQADEHIQHILLEKDKAYNAIMKKRLDEQANALKAEFEEKLRSVGNAFHDQVANEQKRRLESMKQIEKQVEGYELIIQKQSKALARAKRAQEMTAAAMEFMHDSHVAGKPLGKALELLKKASSDGSQGDSTLTLAIGSLSKRCVKEGVKSVATLVKEFDAVLQECRRLSLVPEGGGIVTQAISNVTTRLLSDVPITEVDAILLNAQKAVEVNDISGAVLILEKLPPGLVSQASKDWIRDAKDLVSVEIVRKVALTQALSKYGL